MNKQNFLSSHHSSSNSLWRKTQFHTTTTRLPNHLHPILPHTKGATRRQSITSIVQSIEFSAWLLDSITIYDDYFHSTPTISFGADSCHFTPKVFSRRLLLTSIYWLIVVQKNFTMWDQLKLEIPDTCFYTRYFFLNQPPKIFNTNALVQSISTPMSMSINHRLVVPLKA